MPFFTKWICNNLQEGGVQQISNSFESFKSGNIAQRLIYRLDRKVVGFGNVFSRLVELDHNIGKEGFSRACALFLKYFGVDYRLNCGEDIRRRVTKEPTLIIGLNHNAFIEPLVTGSVIGRDDSFAIANITYTKAGPNISKHLIGVMQSKFATDYPGRRRTRLGDPIAPIYGHQKYTTSEIQNINKKAFRRVGHLLKNRHLVLVYPGGGTPANGSRWRRGIGEIIKNMKEIGLDDIEIVPAVVTGFTRKDVFNAVRTAPHSKPVIQSELRLLESFPIRDIAYNKDTANLSNVLQTRIGALI